MPPIAWRHINIKNQPTNQSLTWLWVYLQEDDLVVSVEVGEVRQTLGELYDKACDEDRQASHRVQEGIGIHFDVSPVKVDFLLQQCNDRPVD